MIVLIDCKSNKEEKETLAPLFNLKSFFKKGEKSTLCISPDSNFFSYRADYKFKMNIFVQKANDTVVFCVTNNTSRSIGDYCWKGTRIMYTQDIGGDENFNFFLLSQMAQIQNP